MTNTAVVKSDENEKSGDLSQRLDTAIGDASTGIGVMMSELVRRSLRSGVSDIERTLTEVTSEKVDLAIELQMPTISEAAHRVAESTSARIVKTVVTESEQRSHEQLQSAVAKFDDAIRNQSETFQASEKHTSDEIANLNTRAQSSWKKVKHHLDQVTTENEQLKSQLQNLAEQLSQVSTDNSQQSSSLKTLIQQNQLLQERVTTLEKPKGLKAVWQKLRSGKSKKISKNQDDS